MSTVKPPRRTFAVIKIVFRLLLTACRGRGQSAPSILPDVAFAMHSRKETPLCLFKDSAACSLPWYYISAW